MSQLAFDGEEDQRELRRERLRRDLRDAEIVYGRGPTLSAEDIALILDGVIPAWLAITARATLDPLVRERCEKGIFCLKRLRKELEK